MSIPIGSRASPPDSTADKMRLSAPRHKYGYECIKPTRSASIGAIAPMALDNARSPRIFLLSPRGGRGSRPKSWYKFRLGATHLKPDFTNMLCRFPVLVKDG